MRLSVLLGAFTGVGSNANGNNKSERNSVTRYKYKINEHIWTLRQIWDEFKDLKVKSNRPLMELSNVDEE